jgi:hypothetical protein
MPDDLPDCTTPAKTRKVEFVFDERSVSHIPPEPGGTIIQTNMGPMYIPPVLPQPPGAAMRVAQTLRARRRPGWRLSSGRGGVIIESVGGMNHRLQSFTRSAARKVCRRVFRWVRFRQWRGAGRRAVDGELIRFRSSQRRPPCR